MNTDICRACAEQETDKMVKLTEDSIKTYTFITNLNVSLDDGLPQNMCLTCIDLVQGFKTFKDKCISVESSFRDNFTTLQIEFKPEEALIKAENENSKFNHLNNNQLALDIMVKKGIKDIKEESHRETPETQIRDVQRLQIDKCESDDFFLFNFMDASDDHINQIYDNRDVKQKNTRKKKKVIRKKQDAVSDTVMADSINKSKKNILQNVPCGLCKKSFDTQEKCVMHLESHQMDSECGLCKDPCTDWAQLAAHRMQHIPKSFWKCYKCLKFFKTPNYLEEHIRICHMHKEENMVCKICAASFSNAKKLAKHVSYTHSGKQYKCPHCSKDISSKQGLTYHMKCHDLQALFVCDICDHSCKRRSNLVAHFARRHLQRGRHRCTHCGRVFKNIKFLKNHNCESLRMSICPHCGKTFIKPSSLNRHVRNSHSDIKRYACDRCPSKYKTKMGLKVHIDRHNGVRPYKCEHCIATFYSLPVLTKHRRVHTGEKPYICKVCCKAFTGGHNLKVHMKVHGEMLVVKRETGQLATTFK